MFVSRFVLGQRFLALGLAAVGPEIIRRKFGEGSLVELPKIKSPTTSVILEKILTAIDKTRSGFDPPWWNAQESLRAKLLRLDGQVSTTAQQ